MPDMDPETIKNKVQAFKDFRTQRDPIYNLVYGEERIRPGMRYLEKMAVLAEVEKMVPDIKQKPLTAEEAEALAYQGLHPVLNCPDLDAATAMYDRILEIRDEGDSSGGIVEVFATGVPAGLGEPVFSKLDGEMGRMMAIGTVKAVELGAGMSVKDMTGSQNNDQMSMQDGQVAFSGNNNGGITGGLTTGQDIVVRLAVKPTPTIAKPQVTVDKVDLVNANLAAVTRRDPTIVSRIWPVAEAFMAMVLLDQYMMHLAVEGLRKND